MRIRVLVLLCFSYAFLYARDYYTFLPLQDNTATYAFVNSPFIRFTYKKYMLDLPEINEGNLDIALPVGKFGQLLFAGDFLTMTPLGYNRLSAGFAKNIRLVRGWSMPLGAEISFNRIYYTTSGFHSFNPNDPLFKAGNSQQDIGLNLAFICNSPYGSVGGSIANLVRPNLSIENSPLGELSRLYTLDLSLTLNKYLELFTTLSYNDLSEYKLSFSPLVRLSDNFLLRLQLNTDQKFKPISTELSIHFLLGGNPTESNILIYYNFSLLNSNGFNSLKSTNHIASVAYHFPPPPILPDLIPHFAPGLPEIISVTESLDLALSIANIGDTISPPCSVTVSVFNGDTLGNYTTLKVSESINVNEQKEISTTLSFATPGRRKIVVEIDQQNYIREKNEENNRIEHTIDVVPTPSGRLALGKLTLRLEQLTHIVEEYPFVPTVFFPVGSSVLPQRMVTSLKEIAVRCKHNPSARLLLYGYIDSSTDPKDWKEHSLHIKRAESVKEALVSYGVSPKQIEIVKSGYNPTKPRTTGEKIVKFAKDIPRIAQENRRVEFAVRLKEISHSFPPDSIEPSQLKKLLAANPDLIFIITGYADPDSPYVAIDKLNSIRERLNLPSALRSRFPILPSFDKEIPTRISPNLEAILYRPTEHTITRPIWQGGVPDTVTIALTFFSPFPLDTYRLEIVDTMGRVLRSLVAGSGSPPSAAKWDWKDESGNVISPDNLALARLYYKDTKGQSGYIKSDTMRVEVDGKVIRTEELVIVEFVFDEVSSISSFLESRLELIASELIKRIDKESTMPRKITFLGHTDIIGDPERNTVLSDERSLKEANLLRVLMTYKLGLSSSEEFFSWLKKRNCIWDAVGLGSSSPFTISNADGTTRIVGNNALPEGRAINRRVILEIEE